MSSASGWMGALRQAAMLYGSLVLEWQCQSEVCRHNSDHSELLMQPLTAGMLFFMPMCVCMSTRKTQTNLLSVKSGEINSTTNFGNINNILQN